MRYLLVIISVLLICAVSAHSQPTLATNTVTNTPSMFVSTEDGWFDVSGFLDQTYGFLPMAMPITEPAIGYGVAGGLAFISEPLGGSEDGFGRPNVTIVGGLGTENGTRGTVIGDIRYWMDDRLQTVAALVNSSVNLDYYGIGEDSWLEDQPLRYNLAPQGVMAQGKYRLGKSRVWTGLSYALTSTDVSFDAPEATPGLPDFREESNVGGITPSVTFDSRDNIFTPVRGTYVETSAGLFSDALGGDEDFQRARLLAMQYAPISHRLFLGLRGDAAASFGDVPFYLRPFVGLRGVPAMRYQGETMAQAEAELRWQLWKRFSLIGFFGGGRVWNEFEQFEHSQKVTAGGAGFRYELARKYGIHMGVDVAYGPDEPAIYLQVGSAWARP